MADVSKEICIIFNLQMKLLLKLRTDERQNNLSIANEVAIIISDEYNQSGFRNIVLAYQHSEHNISQFYTINSNLAAYIPFHYVLFFS